MCSGVIGGAGAQWCICAAVTWGKGCRARCLRAARSHALKPDVYVVLVGMQGVQSRRERVGALVSVICDLGRKCRIWSILTLYFCTLLAQYGS